MTDFKKKPFRELTEKQKDEIINWIIEFNKPISHAMRHFNISMDTMNKIFDKRFNKRKNERINPTNKK